MHTPSQKNRGAGHRRTVSPKHSAAGIDPLFCLFNSNDEEIFYFCAAMGLERQHPHIVTLLARAYDGYLAAHFADFLTKHTPCKLRFSQVKGADAAGETGICDRWTSADMNLSQLSPRTCLQTAKCKHNPLTLQPKPRTLNLKP